MQVIKFYYNGWQVPVLFFSSALSKGEWIPPADEPVSSY